MPRFRGTRYSLQGGRTAGSGVSAFNWFVDSVNGLDSNSGLTALLALQTIAALQAKTITDGQTIGMARGSTWRETFAIPANNITIDNYGTGNLPLFEGADVMPASWTLDSGTVWKQTWTRTSVPSGTEYLQVWINGLLPTRLASSIADLETNGGIFFTSRTSQSTVVFIKSATNPNSSGVLYEAGKRSWAINGHTATLGSTKTGQNINGLEAQRFTGHYNAFSTGQGTYNRCISHYGAVHHTVTESATGMDIICKDQPLLYPISWIPYTAYTSSGAGKTHTASRVIVIGNGTPAGNTNQGIYCHDSATGWDSLTVNQCSASTVQIGVAAAFASLYVNGFYSKDSMAGVYMGAGATVQVKHSIFRNLISGGSGAIYDSGPVDTTVRSRLIENCIIYGSTSAAIIGLSTRRGSLTVRNCLIVMPRDATGIDCGTPDAALNVTIENCIFIGTGDGAGNYKPIGVRTGGGTFTANNNFYIYPNAVTNNKFLFALEGASYTTLAAWKAAISGQDANSQAAFNDTALLTKIFVDPTNGNFTHTGTSGLTLVDGAAISTIGPQEYWNWMSRAAVSGQPTKWPVMPATDAECRSYVDSPAAWNFYP